MCPAAVKFSCLCSEAALYGLLHNFLFSLMLSVSLLSLKHRAISL